MYFPVAFLTDVKENWFMGCTTFSDLQSRCNNTSQNSTGNCFQSLAALSSSVAWFSIYTFTQHKWHVRSVDPSLEEQRFQEFKKTQRQRRCEEIRGEREGNNSVHKSHLCLSGQTSSPSTGSKFGTAFTMLLSLESHKSLSYFLTLARGRKSS